MAVTVMMVTIISMQRQCNYLIYMIIRCGIFVALKKKIFKVHNFWLNKTSDFVNICLMQ